MILAVILIKTEADQWDGGLTHPFLPKYFEKVHSTSLNQKQKYLGWRITHITHKIGIRFCI